MSNVPTIPVVVLAAGASRRFGSDKLQAQVDGRPLLELTLDAALDVVELELMVVVVAADQVERIGLCRSVGIDPVIAVDAARGMGWSLRAGLDACEPAAPGAIIVLGDDPLALRILPAVVAAAEVDDDTIVAIRREPFLPHPVYLPRAAWPPAPTGDDDGGLRQLLDDDATWILDEGVHPVDVDLPADVAKLTQAMRLDADS